MKHHLTVEGHNGILNLQGKLTISNAAELKEVLLAALEGVKKLTLQCDQVEGADLSALQLFCSAHRFAVKQEKEICFGDPRSDILIKTIKNAGYEKTMGCYLDRNNSCIWLKFS